MFNFNHVTISVDNLENTLEFYRKFGFILQRSITMKMLIL